MINNTVINCSKNSFIEKQLFKLKVNESIKECERIKENLKKDGKVKREDIKVNIVIPCTETNSIKEKYFVHKGYNKDGSLRPVKKYSLYDGQIVEQSGNIAKRILILDLYEKSICLYDYQIDEEYANGYILKEEKGSSGNINMIFTREKVKVLLKNVNAYYEYQDVDAFMDMFLM